MGLWTKKWSSFPILSPVMFDTTYTSPLSVPPSAGSTLVVRFGVEPGLLHVCCSFASRSVAFGYASSVPLFTASCLLVGLWPLEVWFLSVETSAVWDWGQCPAEGCSWTLAELHKHQCHLADTCTSCAWQSLQLLRLFHWTDDDLAMTWCEHCPTCWPCCGTECRRTEGPDLRRFQMEYHIGQNELEAWWWCPWLSCWSSSRPRWNKRGSQLSRGTAVHPFQKDQSQLLPMGSGHCCAVSTFLSGCGASSAGTPHSVLLSALCLGPYLASTTALVLVSTCCHSQDGQSAVSSSFHFSEWTESGFSPPSGWFHLDDSSCHGCQSTDGWVQERHFSWLAILRQGIEEPDLFALLHGPPVLSCLRRLAKSSSPLHEHQSQDQEEKHDLGCLQWRVGCLVHTGRSLRICAISSSVPGYGGMLDWAVSSRW